MIFSCLGFAWLWFHAKWITFVFLVQWYPSLPQRKHNVKRINILVLCILLRFFSIINAEIGLITYFRIYENCIESGLHADSLLFTQSWKSPNVWSNLHRVKHIFSLFFPSVHSQQHPLYCVAKYSPFYVYQSPNFVSLFFSLPTITLAISTCDNCFGVFSLDSFSCLFRKCATQFKMVSEWSSKRAKRVNL